MTPLTENKSRDAQAFEELHRGNHLNWLETVTERGLRINVDLAYAFI